MVFYYGTDESVRRVTPAAVVESADTKDLKSFDRNIVPVQVRSAAPKTTGFGLSFFYPIRMPCISSPSVTLAPSQQIWYNKF